MPVLTMQLLTSGSNESWGFLKILAIDEQDKYYVTRSHESGRKSVGPIDTSCRQRSEGQSLRPLL